MSNSFIHHSLRIALFLLALPIVGWSQEICDNGIDDDGDGFIDLHDSECICHGITVVNPGPNLIPNPSFDAMNWCPGSFGEMNAVVSWETGSLATPDYLHTCDFVWPAIPSAGLVPFPDGNGVLGLTVLPSHMEYVATCLNGPFVAGNEYTLVMDIASVPLGFAGSTCNNGIITYGPINFSLYGNPSCGNIPVSTYQCPLSADPSWVLLDFETYNPQSVWSEITFTFTPAQDMEALMIGPPCPLPSDYTGSPCIPYFVIDNLRLDEVQHYDELDILASGYSCTPDFTLLAIAPLAGGTWQWYFNGVAMQGQQSDVFLLADNGHLPGTYIVMYSLNGECILDSIEITNSQTEPIDVTVFFCPGSFGSCAGKEYTLPGSYEVWLVTPEGCDSLVRCHIMTFPESPITTIHHTACAPFVFQVCGQDLFTETGEYDIICLNNNGCDSLVHLNLVVLDPEVIIVPPNVLSCDPQVGVEVDGSLSYMNVPPMATVQWTWTGPPGGITDGQNTPIVTVNLPGTYCLKLTISHDGLMCSDSLCVQVTQSNAPPMPPVGLLPPHLCLNDTISIPLPPDAVNIQWFTQNGLQLWASGDSLLLLNGEQPGSYTICGYGQSSCGNSDTLCQTLVVVAADTLFLETSTCIPDSAGQFYYFHTGEFGCDSLVVHDILLRPTHWQVQSSTTCDSLSAGTDTLAFINQFGCDSTIIREVVFSPHFEEWQTIKLCGMGSNYSDTTVVQSGPCDSLFITLYQFHPFDTTWLQGATCDPSQAGLFTSLFTSQTGCDSTVITTVSLLPRDTIIDEGVTCDPSQELYEIISLTNQYGCDSTVWVSIVFVGVDTTWVERQVCDSTLVGTNVLLFPLSGTPCDSVVVETVHWALQTVTLLTKFSCDAIGPASDTSQYTSYAGCDSLVVRQYTYTDLQAAPQSEDVSCFGAEDGQLFLTSTSGGAPPYAYRINDGAWQTESTFSELIPGNYTLTVRDNNGCTREYPGIIIQEGEVILLDAGPDHEVDLGAVVNLSVQSSQSLNQVQWTATDPFACGSCPQTAIGPVTASQMVMVQGWTLSGCSDVDTVLICLRAEAVPEVYIPNSFSPNGDGINDIFSVYGNLQLLSVRNMAVYDRWGNALYSQKDLAVNDPSQGWDGTFRDKRMDPGVYVYVVEVELNDGSIRIYKGDVTIVR